MGADSPRSHFRKELRIAIRFPVEFRSEDGGTAYQAMSRDLSSGGILLSATKAPAAGSRVKLSFHVGHESRLVQTHGIVRRLRLDPETEDEARYLIAVGFDEQSEAMVKHLRRIVMDLILGMVERIHDFPAFRGLTEYDLVTLASVCHLIDLEGGELLARQGDEAQSLFVVSEGLVRLSHRGEGEEKGQVEVAGKGQIFGEVSALTGLPHDLDIEALESTELIALPRAGLDHLKSTQPETALRLMDVFMRFTGIRLRRITRRMFSPITMR